MRNISYWKIPKKLNQNFGLKYAIPNSSVRKNCRKNAEKAYMGDLRTMDSYSVQLQLRLHITTIRSYRVQVQLWLNKNNRKNRKQEKPVVDISEKWILTTCKYSIQRTFQNHG